MVIADPKPRPSHQPKVFACLVSSSRTDAFAVRQPDRPAGADYFMDGTDIHDPVSFFRAVGEAINGVFDSTLST